jgi:hypothetical protein
LTIDDLDYRLEQSSICNRRSACDAGYDRLDGDAPAGRLVWISLESYFPIEPFPQMTSEYDWKAGQHQEFIERSFARPQKPAYPAS